MVSTNNKSRTLRLRLSQEQLIALAFEDGENNSLQSFDAPGSLSPFTKYGIEGLENFSTFPSAQIVTHSLSLTMTCFSVHI